VLPKRSPSLCQPYEGMTGSLGPLVWWGFGRFFRRVSLFSVPVGLGFVRPGCPVWSGL
jgi:hypothetical protein